MRLYCFTNMYLSSIQNGIQPLHATVELFLEYHDRASIQNKLLYDWANFHKTVIVLNGGPTENLYDIDEIVSQTGYPYASFYEPGLAGALTCICVVVPTKIYELKPLDEEDEDLTNFLSLILGGGLPEKKSYNEDYTEAEIKLIELIQSCSLAK